jgi:predicted  nucleic acid-binding Zn-ribbon protein
MQELWTAYSTQHKLRNEVYELRSSLSACNSTLQHLAAVLHALEERLAHLWYRSEQHIARLEGRLEVISAACHKAAEQWANALEVGEMAARATEASEKLLASCRAELDAAHRKAHTLEDSLAEERRRTESARDEAVRLRRQVEELERGASTAEGALAAALAQVKDEAARSAELTAEVACLTQQLEDATRHVDAREAEIMTCKAAAAAEAAALGQRLRGAEEECVAAQRLLQEKVAAWDEERRRLEGQLEARLAEMEGLRTAVAERDDALRRTKVCAQIFVVSNGKPVFFSLVSQAGLVLPFAAPVVGRDEPCPPWNLR